MFNILKLVKINLITLAVVSTGFISCKKMVAVDPPVANLTTLSAFRDDNTAIAVMTGHFSVLSNGTGFPSLTGMSQFTGLSSDELNLWTGSSYINQQLYYTNDLFSNAVGSAGDECWRDPYAHIYTCNTVIEGITASNSLSEKVRNQLMGEAKFMRAFYFFYLVNLYGDIPMPLTTDFEVNRLLSKKPKTDVYSQIKADLLDAQSLLSSEFLDGGLRVYLPTLPVDKVERVRPTKWAAAALLARAYLYTGEFAKAELAASSIINKTDLFSLNALNDVFKKNSKEAIWQLQPVTLGMNTIDGAFFVLSSAGPTDYNPVYINQSLLNAFEAGDNRNVIDNWVDSVVVLGTPYYFPYKYKLGYGTTEGLEYLMVLRLGEQYLIRAEARAKLGNITGARDDLFAIRRRAGLTDATLTANDQPTLLTAILHERQVELFCEWGHRWFDLKRTGNVDAVMNAVTPLKGGTWETTDQLYPIPFSDIQRNPNMTQNPGY